MLAVVLDHVFHDLDTERRLLGEVGVTLSEDRTLLPDADVVLVCYAPLTAEMIGSLKRCRVISRYGVGFDNIDVAAAARRGIVVTYVPDYCMDEVSDHTVALLLSWARKTCVLNAHVQSGRWDLTPAKPMHRLRGQTLGIVGYGRIGRMVAQKAAAFGLRILAYDPIVPIAAPAEGVAFGRLLRESDYVSLHLPLSDSTRWIIAGEALATMKPGAVLINTSRGGLVDEQALSEALQAGRIGGAALDVLAAEGAGSPLCGLRNVILTPHAAFYSEESQAELQRRAAENAVAVLSGRAPRHVVPEVFEEGD